MTISEMIGQSGILTLLGMGVVFGFLIIMILSMYLLHAVLHALKWDKIEEPPAPKASAAPSASAPAAADQGAVVAAIAAALHEKNV